MFIATAGTHELTIEDPSPTNGSYGSLLDYVSVSPCGCPSGVANSDDYDMDINSCNKYLITGDISCDVVTFYSECHF